MKMQRAMLYRDLKLIRFAGRAYKTAKTVGTVSVLFASVCIGIDIIREIRKAASG